jgi:N-sulfoglucosamine sulfohydrolase
VPRCFTCLVLLLTVLSAGDAGLPDFVVFLSDDHGHLDATPDGATEVRTPQMQRLADDGIVFTHTFIAAWPGVSRSGTRTAAPGKKE